MACLLHVMPVHHLLCVTALLIAFNSHSKPLSAHVAQLSQACTAGNQLLSVSSVNLLCCAVLCCAVLCFVLLIAIIAGICLPQLSKPPHLSGPFCHAENGRCTRRGSQDTQGQDSCSLHHRQCTCESHLITEFGLMLSILVQLSSHPMPNISGSLFCM